MAYMYLNRRMGGPGRGGGSSGGGYSNGGSGGKFIFCVLCHSSESQLLCRFYYYPKECC